jgi:hypothetical protein
MLKVRSRHPNLYALSNVLRRIGKDDFGVVVLLGDVVSPSELDRM